MNLFGSAGGGLHLDQAPPLAIPASFFLLAPVSALAAGALLLAGGSNALLSPWTPLTQALAHLGTLGFLTAVMLGALYQMTPVVAGVAVPAIRLAHGVQALLALGVVALVVALSGRGPQALWHAALGLLGLAFLLFLAPVGLALLRSPTRTETTHGLRLAVVCLLLVCVLGLWLGAARITGDFPASRALWLQVHLSLAFLGWVGGLIVAVSWQVVPMFYVGEEWSPRARKLSLAGIALGTLAPLLALALGTSTRLAALASLPAVGVVWLQHPLLTLRSIARRKRVRPDASLLFWRAGLGVALLTGPAGVVAQLSDDPRWSVLFGWLVIWGWGSMIVHGMLVRIVPFLVWFHRFSPHVGKVKLPSMRGLLSQRRIQVGFWLHLASVVAGAAAALSGSDLLARATGVLLAAVGVVLGANLIHTLRQTPAEALRAA